MHAKLVCFWFRGSHKYDPGTVAIRTSVVELGVIPEHGGSRSDS